MHFITVDSGPLMTYLNFEVIVGESRATKTFLFVRDVSLYIIYRKVLDCRDYMTK